MERGLSCRRRELRPRVHRKNAHSGLEGFLFGIAVKDRRGSRQSLYLRSLFPPVPSLRFSSAKACKGYNMESTRQQRFVIQSPWFREADGSCCTFVSVLFFGSFRPAPAS